MHQSQPLIAVLDRLKTDIAWLIAVRAELGCSGIGLQNANGEWLNQIGSPCPDAPWHELRGDDGAVHSCVDGQVCLSVPLLLAYGNTPNWCMIWDEEQRSEAQLYALLAKATARLARHAVAHNRAAAEHHAELIERAAATARIGVWSCTLPDQALSWSDGVYDLFELPRRSFVAREIALSLYTPVSAALLEKKRAHAIATLSGFSMDADIVTAKGEKRVMRVTAAVDHINGVPTQIYGIKQDITAEKELAERTRLMAETDALTGLANRMKFQERLDDLHGDTNGVTTRSLVLIDLDNFKTINDSFGHLVGDACLHETAKRLVACAPEGALVARLGGDEFAILIDETAPCTAYLPAAILEALRPPLVSGNAIVRLGVSMGIADRHSTDVADTLYHNADLALYAAKQAGRGTWRMFQAA